MDNQTGRKATSARERKAMDVGSGFGAKQDGRNSRTVIQSGDRIVMEGDNQKLSEQVNERNVH
jgi:hypothetical protein